MDLDLLQLNFLKQMLKIQQIRDVTCDIVECVRTPNLAGSAPPNRPNAAGRVTCNSPLVDYLFEAKFQYNFENNFTWTQFTLLTQNILSMKKGFPLSCLVMCPCCHGI